MLLTLLKPQVVVWLKKDGQWRATRPWRKVNGAWTPCATFLDKLGTWVR